jgi:ATP-dependent RNA helicase UAP56/SUB2
MEPEVRIGNFVGGISLKSHIDLLSDTAKRPHIVIGTPGRLLDLVKQDKMKLDDIKYFIVDECDKVLDQAGATSARLLDFCFACFVRLVYTMAL